MRVPVDRRSLDRSTRLDSTRLARPGIGVSRTCVRNRRWTAGRCAQLWGDVLKLHVCRCKYTSPPFSSTLTMNHGRVRRWRRVSCTPNETIVFLFLSLFSFFSSFVRSYKVNLHTLYSIKRNCNEFRNFYFSFYLST